MNVSAVLVTRGDVDLTAIIQSFGDHFTDLIVWDNSERQDLSVYGRYAALDEVENQVVYCQDDDCIVDVEAILDAYQPGRLVANMPQSRWAGYPDSTMVGWGADSRGGGVAAAAS